MSSARLPAAPALAAWLFAGVLSLSLVECDGKTLPLGARPRNDDTGGSFGSGGTDAAGGTSNAATAGTAGSAGSTAQGGASGDSGDAGEGGAPSAGSGPLGGTGGATGILRFTDASPVASINSEGIEDNPTLTEDLLQIFFTSDADGGDMDVWTATRSSTTASFGAPARVPEANTTSVETSPAIALDGLTLWVGQDRADGLGGYDIWALSRPSLDAAFSMPVNVAELNSPLDDIPRPVALDNRVMPLGSRRGQDGYRTYLASRASPDDPFETPVLVDEIVMADHSVVDGFMSEDGLLLFYSAAAAEGEGDLYYVTRSDPGAPWSAPIPISDLNSTADERDPWLSPDQTRFYFATDREDGDLDIFSAMVTRDPGL